MIGEWCYQAVNLQRLLQGHMQRSVFNDQSVALTSITLFGKDADGRKIKIISSKAQGKRVLA